MERGRERQRWWLNPNPGAGAECPRFSFIASLMRKSSKPKRGTGPTVPLTYGRDVLVESICTLLLRGSIVIGQQQDSVGKHAKRGSLDYWLRRFGKPPNTKQADNKFIKDLLRKHKGLFKRTKIINPNTGRSCKGIELTDKGRTRAEKKKRVSRKEAAQSSTQTHFPLHL